MLIGASVSFAQTNAIQSTGPVGIGTLNPSRLLYIRQTSVSNPGYNPLFGLGYSDTETFGGSLGLRVVSSNPRQGLKISSNLDFTFHSPVTTSNPAFQWQTGSVQDESSDAATVMTISGLGNVGIGTATPGDRLHVKVSGSDSGISLDDGGLNYNPVFTISRAGVPRLSLSATSLVGTVSGRGGNGLALSGNWTSQDMFIAANGNVGIGTSTPSNTLDVRSGGSSTAIGLLTSSQAADALRLMNADGSLRISNGTTANLLNLVYGNVGIGTTNPTQKLSVNGTIRAKEVIVETTGWSDYVFADNYVLQPLAEVEAHIKTNKHLPGIPSANEVAETGIGVGEMQAKLLAKIEELTLHQIEQEKEIRRLNQEVRRIPELQAELAKLQK